MWSWRVENSPSSGCNWLVSYGRWWTGSEKRKSGCTRKFFSQKWLRKSVRSNTFLRLFNANLGFYLSLKSKKLLLIKGCGSVCSWLGLWPTKMWLAWPWAHAKMDVAGCAGGPAKNGFQKFMWLAWPLVQPNIASWAFGPAKSGCQNRKSGCTHVCSVWAFLGPWWWSC